MPTDSDKNLCKIDSIENWLVVLLDGGETKEIKTYKKKDDINEFIDYVILSSKNEDINEFLEEGISVLLAPFQKSIEDVIEAYMFRELHEVTN
jgi:hypothetical protein